MYRMIRVIFKLLTENLFNAKVNMVLTSCAGNWLRTVTSDQNRIQ